MTQQFEDFVNAALDKSLASDVTLPTANKIPVYTGIGRQVTGKTPAELGLAVNSTLALKADLVDGVVPASQLPSYVDDVLEFANLASFPVTGESGKVYVAIDTKKTYRWSGSTYVQIGSDLALGETASTAYRGDRGKTAYDHSEATGNPHGATTANINDSADRRYVTDAKLTVLNNTSGTNSGDETQASIKTTLGAASSGVDGYLTGSDWDTFNGKQAALTDVVTADTYGNSTQYPVITFNVKGIATGVTLQTVSVAEVSDSVFRVVDNSDATKKLAFEASGIGTGQTRTITMPNIDVDLGKAVYRKDIFNLPVPLSSLRAGDEIDLTVSLATVSMQHSDTFSTVKGYYFNNNTPGTVTFTLSRSLGTAPPTTLTNIDGVTGETLSSQDFTVTPTAFDYTVYIPRYGRLLISPGSSGQVRLVVYSPQSNSISTNNSLWCESTTLAGSHNTAIKCKDLKIHANQKFGHFEDLWGFPLTSQLPGATSPANGILVPIGTKMRGFKGNSVVGSTSGCRVEAVFTRTVVGTSGATVTMSDSDGITPYSHMSQWSGNDPVTEHYITLRKGNAYSLTLYTVGPSSGSGAIVGSTTLHSVGTLPAVSVSISGGRLIASFTPPGQAYYSYEIRSVYGVDL